MSHHEHDVVICLMVGAAVAGIECLDNGSMAEQCRKWIWKLTEPNYI